MTNHRSNQEWLDHLRGLQGDIAQERAHRELGHYLHKVAYNYLLKRQVDVPLLFDLEGIDLSEWAQDGVQDVLEKLSRNDFALLEQYRGDGRFLAWTALIVRNHIAGQLRHSQYSKRRMGLDEVLFVPTEDVGPTRSVVLQEIIRMLQDCLSKLPKHMSFVLVECIAKQRRSKEVAEEMARTENAVNLLVMRAKQRVRTCLQVKGIGPDVLDLF